MRHYLEQDSWELMDNISLERSDLSLCETIHLKIVHEEKWQEKLKEATIIHKHASREVDV